MTMETISAELLREASGSRSLAGGVTIRTDLEPLAGLGAPVKPAVYAGSPPSFQREKRWWVGSGEKRVVDAIIIDNVPSQANRAEAALRDRAAELGLPELIVDLSSLEALPPHLPRRLSSFEFPHRHADAYLRDALLDGEPFPSSADGKALFAATAQNPAALLRWSPQSLVYGFWQSHLGKGRTQAKLARAWRSEIVGYEPADGEARQRGLKGDPLNLAKGEGVHYSEGDPSDWEVGSAPKGRKRGDLSDLGHGQVPIGGDGTSAPIAVSFAAVEQRSTLSMPDLRRVVFDNEEQTAAARALLAALALVGHTQAHAGSFSLRSGADLRVASASWTWMGPDGDVEVAPLMPDAAEELLQATVAEAEAAGLPVGSGWSPRQLMLEPNEALRTAIMATYPATD